MFVQSRDVTVIEFRPKRPVYKVFGAEISGISPLLMHAPTAIMDQTGGPRRKQKPGPESAERAAYRTADGYLCIKADHIRQAMVNAGMELKLGRQKMAQFVQRGFEIQDPEFLILREGEPLMTWDEIDVRPVNIKGNRVPAYRPLIRVPWSAIVRFRYNTEYFPDPVVLVQLLEHAGLYIGIMDYRPERGGLFGRFVVEKAWIEEEA